ncbi:2Fe-2S iron-sulfur cluster-binding protein [Streptomyces sp. NPDC005574]|uniref:2Fe-2S iron-sulfur cluster-binding protein n=1 Tax=Streptomyces sp. NPDC005574 TaxID=3156891 RepID=UPI0033B4644C
MTDDQHAEGTPRSGGRWDPLPQGDYDDGATAFVKLPEGGIEALLAAADTPLAAPGHGYVPPQITATPGTEPGADPASGTWAMPAEAARWPDPNEGPHGAGDDRFTYRPGSTGQWEFGDVTAADAPAAPGHDVTGQWSIPVAGGDLPDESGEFTTSALVEQWGGTPPATLPGGASAPWATQPGQPWEPAAAERPDTAGHAQAPAHLLGRPDEAPAAPGHAGPAPVDHDPSAGHYGETPAEAAVAASQAALEAAEAQEAAEAALEAAEAAQRPAEPFSEPGTDTSDGTTGPETAGEPAEDPADGTPGAASPDSPDSFDSPDSPDSFDNPDSPDSPDNSDASVLSGEEHPLASYVLRVNGTERPVSDAWIGESLLYVLRERLGLAGAKDGCSQGECGACNVQVDGRLVASCLVPAVTAAGSEVRTVEGLAVDGQPSDVQRALARCGAVQCGFCVPGMAMTVHDLLEGNPAPTELETRQALCGNLCRCSGYRGVVEAVKEVAAEREAHGRAGDVERDGDEARIPHQAGPGAGGVNPSAFESPRTHDQAYGQDGGPA